MMGLQWRHWHSQGSHLRSVLEVISKFEVAVGWDGVDLAGPWDHIVEWKWANEKLEGSERQ